LGEWLSVQSSRELYEHQISIEAREIKDAPEEELEELALIYQSKGLTADKAHELAAQIMSDEAITIDTLAREELGVNPDELGGSAWEAAITSFILFALGAIIPLAPYFFLTGMTAVFTSLGVSALGLFIIGALITILTGKNAVKAGLRQVIIGLLAAGIIYGIGHLVGGTIGG
jgi:vacuolar iron transporter family protein